MINKKNYFILAGISLTLCLAYLGILSAAGFTNLWKWWRYLLFIIMTTGLIYGPVALLLKIHAKINQPPTPEKK